MQLAHNAIILLCIETIEKNHVFSQSMRLRPVIIISQETFKVLDLTAVREKKSHIYSYLFTYILLFYCYSICCLSSVLRT